MLSRLVLLACACAVMLVAGCGDGANGPTGPEAADASISCPVEGTRFRSGRGFDVVIDGRKYEVCSRGCAIRLEATPEAYVGGR